MISFLFWNFITSIFAFGGGSSLLSYLYDIYIIKLSIITPYQFSQMSVISNILPGPVSISFISMVGFYINPYIGWLLGIISFSFMTIVYSWFFYYKLGNTKFIKSISDYIIPIIITSLIVVLFKIFFVPFSMKWGNWIFMDKLMTMFIISLLLKYKRIKKNTILIINIILAIILANIW